MFPPPNADRITIVMLAMAATRQLRNWPVPQTPPMVVRAAMATAVVIFQLRAWMRAAGMRAGWASMRRVRDVRVMAFVMMANKISKESILRDKGMLIEGILWK